MSGLIYILLRQLRFPLIILISVYSISILGFVLIPGEDDQGNVWHMSFFHAFYFVSFMGTTIGFGEIPYEFTNAQRFWALVAIYGTVIAWLYGIGSLFSIMQDPAFRRLTVETLFRRRVKAITEPFYLICGYGDTGNLLVKGLSDEGMKTVVLDINQERVNDLEATNFVIQPSALQADASRLKYLKMAGIEHKYCQGVVALTNNDQSNLTIATAVHLLNKDIRLISIAETSDIEANITSFGANIVINPYETFARQLGFLITSPGMYTLFEWLTGIPHDNLSEPEFPKEGRWIVCGYDSFGKAIHQRLIDAELDVDVTVVTPHKEDIIHLEQAVSGIGVKADVLEQAGIKRATGIVAGTENDANNLSIIMTAKEQNPDIFVVSRQNQRPHFPIFEAADIDLVMQRGSVIAHTIFALVRSPLLGEFIRLAEYYSDEWANKLVSRIAGIVHDKAPSVWETEISHRETPAIYAALQKKRNIKLKTILRSPRNRDELCGTIPLLLYRKDREYLLPDTDQKIKLGDRILFCGNELSRKRFDWVSRDIHTLRYVITGTEASGGYIWQWLMSNQKTNNKKDNDKKPKTEKIQSDQQ